MFPVLIAALQGLIGFPLTSIMLRREAARLKAEYRDGQPRPRGRGRCRPRTASHRSRLPAALRTTPGTLFVVGVVVLVSIGINNLTDGILNTFVVALIFGIGLRTARHLQAVGAGGIDSWA